MAYTIGVWVGNFEGGSMHEVSGVMGAAPVWQELMLALHDGGQSVAPTPPVQLISALTRFDPAVEAPRPGAHRLALVDDAGRVVDQILFTVR
ncbi:MAG: hypothetical protein WD929_03315 [Steroidobacteraceae bacterium]